MACMDRRRVRRMVHSVTPIQSVTVEYGKVQSPKSDASLQVYVDAICHTSRQECQAALLVHVKLTIRLCLRRLNEGRIHSRLFMVFGLPY